MYIIKDVSDNMYVNENLDGFVLTKNLDEVIDKTIGKPFIESTLQRVRKFYQFSGIKFRKVFVGVNKQ